MKLQFLMSKSYPQTWNAVPISAATPILGCWHGPTWSSPISHAPSSKPTPFHDSLQSHFPSCAAVTLLETPVPLGRAFGCPGNWASWGGGGESHTQVLSCLVVEHQKVLDQLCKAHQENPAHSLCRTSETNT